MKKVLWIGPVIKPEDIRKHPAISPAGNKWQSSFIKALENIGFSVVIFSYLPDPYFPKGRLIPYYSGNALNNSMMQHSYVNLPFIREKSLAHNLKKSMHNLNDFDYVITYNGFIPHIKAAKLAISIFHTKWINIVADSDYVKGPDLNVFLSYGFYQKATIENKIHLDGGVEKYIGSEFTPLKKKILLFSGAINKWTGIEEFALDFSQLERDDFELHIFGKGESGHLKTLSSNFKNIILKGFVSEEELDRASKNSFAFINPRPLYIKGGEKNFPSKILEYLKYGKPIISSRTEGLAPYYDQLLFYYEPSQKASLNDVLNEINSINNDDFCQYQKKLRTFCENHSWNQQAHSLMNEIKGKRL